MEIWNRKLHLTITETFTTFVLPNNQTVVNGFPLNAGDTISFQYYNASAYPGQASHLQGKCTVKHSD